MGVENRLRTWMGPLVLVILLAVFIIVASGEGYCDSVWINPGLPYFKLPPTITVSPNPVMVGETVTVRGSSFNTTPAPGSTEPMVACVIGYPTKIQPDGTWVITSSFTGPGTREIYAEDFWGHQSNVVTLVITEPVTFKATVYSGSTASPFTQSGVMCIKYPANMSGHYELSYYGLPFTDQFAMNGTTAEIWCRSGALASDHVTVNGIEAGNTYAFNLVMPTPTPAPLAIITPTPVPGTPTQVPGVTATPWPSGTTDTVAPTTTLNFTGISDNAGIYTSNVVCTLTAKDEGGSGVNDTAYSFDGSLWITYTGPFTISVPGNSTVFYRSIDTAGNEEVAGVASLVIAGSASPTPEARGSGICPALVLPLLLAGFVGLYRMRKGR